MKTRKTTRNPLGPIVLAGGLIAIVTIAAGSALAAQPSGWALPTIEPYMSPAKQAAVEQERQQLLYAESLPHAPKPDVLMTPAPNCPRTDLANSFGPFRTGPFPGGANLVSAAALVVGGASYQVYTGATDADPTQGVVIVIKDGNEDPCAAMTGAITTYQRSYLTDADTGSVRITAIDTTGVDLAAANGTTLHFSVAAGQFP